MIAAAVIRRLRESVLPPFALVEGAAALANVADVPNATPAAFVVPMREASGDNERMTGVLQRVEVDFAVVIVARNLTDPRESAAAGDLDELKAAVRSQLVGWVPDGAEDVVTHVSGELTKARGGTVWWEDVFATAIYLEA